MSGFGESDGSEHHGIVVGGQARSAHQPAFAKGRPGHGSDLHQQKASAGPKTDDVFKMNFVRNHVYSRGRPLSAICTSISSHQRHSGDLTRCLRLFFLATMVVLVSFGPTEAADVRVLDANAHMYPGETLAEAAGHQVLYAFESGDKSKPMMVFVPGDAHLARIFYGYPSGRAEDFVAHWVKEAGHPFLAVSYPLANPVFSETVPGYTIADWGNQVAAVIAEVQKENDLTAPVIVAGWSMGGKIAASVGRAAKTNGTEIIMFVAMSADPPVPGFLPAANVESIKLDENGYADRTPIYAWFLNAISEQDAYNGHTIISKDTYIDQFLGAVPIDLIDTGTVYKDGKLVQDLAMAVKTSGVNSFEDYPLPVLIHDNSTSDFENVLLDASDWTFVRNRVLINHYMGGLKPTDLTTADWQQLQLLVSFSQSFFTETVEGNHFFFIGEIGARKAVEKIITLHAKVESLPPRVGSE